MKSYDLVVGQKVILKRSMLGEHVGSVGYVYETYRDFDSPDYRGASIIFMGGGYDGFSLEEQGLYLDVGDVDQRYSMYQFKNVNQVWRDYQNGYWQF